MEFRFLPGDIEWSRAERQTAKQSQDQSIFELARADVRGLKTRYPLVLPSKTKGTRYSLARRAEFVNRRIHGIKSPWDNMTTFLRVDQLCRKVHHR